jgi:hypothetical protein
LKKTESKNCINYVRKIIRENVKNNRIVRNFILQNSLYQDYFLTKIPSDEFILGKSLHNKMTIINANIRLEEYFLHRFFVIEIF